MSYSTIAHALISYVDNHLEDFNSQIGYSQSASLLAHNLIAAIAAFPWESALPRKQGSPNPPLSPWRLRSGGLP